MMEFFILVISLTVTCFAFYMMIVSIKKQRKDKDNNSLEDIKKEEVNSAASENSQGTVIVENDQLENDDQPAMKRKFNKKIVIPILAAFFIIVIAVIGIDISGIPVFDSQINRIRLVHNWNIQTNENPDGITRGKRIKRSELNGYSSDEISINVDYKVQINYANNGSRISTVDLIYMGSPSKFSQDTSLPYIRELLKILDIKNDINTDVDSGIANGVFNAITQAKKDNLYEEADAIFLVISLSDSKQKSYELSQNVDIDYKQLLIGAWKASIVSFGVKVADTWIFNKDSSFTYVRRYDGYYEGTDWSSVYDFMKGEYFIDGQTYNGTYDTYNINSGGSIHLAIDEEKSGRFNSTGKIQDANGIQTLWFEFLNINECNLSDDCESLSGNIHNRQ